MEEYRPLTAPQLPLSRIVPVIAHAVAVFGDEHKASRWLSTPLPLLENRSPKDLLNSDEGIQKVDEILTRIEHNIFS
jgi:putative toxin-antitoxin system antitoxin component (TIGR02293 family)